MRTFNRNIFILFGLLTLGMLGCKKLVQIPPPESTITTSQVFSTDEQATSAMVNVYSSMINYGGLFCFRGGLSIYCGLSADEFVSFDQIFADGIVQYQDNDLISTNSINAGNFWIPIYSYVYDANAIIEGLQNYSGVHDSIKSELTGEAQFVRALCYFYLENLYGNVPLVTTINFNTTSLLGNSDSASIFGLIISDLKAAQSSLPSDYSISGGYRIRPNKWAAMALLSRVYLYQGNWHGADSLATAIIGSGNFNLVGLDSVYLANSNEAIWQLQQNSAFYPFNATAEGNTTIPLDSTSQPYIYLSPTLLDAFDSGDQRRIVWVDSTNYNGIIYYYPYKYNVGPSLESAGVIPTQYYMVFRLAEQYLIRAEAEVEVNDLAAGVSDINLIRARAGLPALVISSQAELLAAIAHERFAELFGEWGNRWLDLKRTGQAVSVLSMDKGISVSQTSLLYPIPISELQTDPNLHQNPGYQ